MRLCVGLRVTSVVALLGGLRSKTLDRYPNQKVIKRKEPTFLRRGFSMPMKSKFALPPILFLVLSFVAASVFAFEDPESKIISVLPKDKIKAIFSPMFVDADKARISDDAKVIGVEINGDARAYSINLLNGHEIVDDEVGNQKIAVTW